MTEINYVRNLSGACLTVVRGAPQLGLPIPPHGKQWGFCSIRSWLAAYLRRVAALMMQFPPIGGGDLAVCSGVVAKLQTHWVKRLQKRLFLLNGSAIWRNRSLSWCVVRALALEHARYPVDSHVNPQICAWAQPSTLHEVG